MPKGFMLKPCPKCKKDPPALQIVAEFFDDAASAFVYCRACGTRGPRAVSSESEVAAIRQAQAGWNGQTLSESALDSEIQSRGA